MLKSVQEREREMKGERKARRERHVMEMYSEYARVSERERKMKVVMRDFPLLFPKPKCETERERKERRKRKREGKNGTRSERENGTQSLLHTHSQQTVQRQQQAASVTASHAHCVHVCACVRRHCV